MHKRKCKGIASVELALALPVLLIFVMGVVETGDALRVYQTVLDASKEGARLYVREGGDADVQGLVENLTSHLPVTSTTTTVDADQDLKKVTVEVHCEYTPFFGSEGGTVSMPLAARTAMPIP